MSEAIHKKLRKYGSDLHAINGELPEYKRRALLKKVFKMHREMGFAYPNTPQLYRAIRDFGILKATPSLKPGGKVVCTREGTAYCSYFQPHRFHCVHQSSDKSVYEAFHDDTCLEEVLESCYDNVRKSFAPYQVRTKLASKYLAPSTFLPSATVGLVRRYCMTGGLVFDPYAGWGGKMLGTAVANREYLGVDACGYTVEGLMKMGDNLEQRGLMKGAALCSLLEDYQPTRKADMILASPPYWEQDIYPLDRDTVSFGDWPDIVLRPMFEVAVQMTKANGPLCIHVSDVVKGREKPPSPLSEVVVAVAVEYGYRKVDMHPYRRSRTDRYVDSILVFRR